MVIILAKKNACKLRINFAIANDVSEMIRFSLEMIPSTSGDLNCNYVYLSW